MQVPCKDIILSTDASNRLGCCRQTILTQMAPPSPAKRGVTVGKRGKSAPKKKEIIISRDDAGGVLVSGSTFPIKDHLKEHGALYIICSCSMSQKCNLF